MDYNLSCVQFLAFTIQGIRVSVNLLGCELIFKRNLLSYDLDTIIHFNIAGIIKPIWLSGQL